MDNIRRPVASCGPESAADTLYVLGVILDIAAGRLVREDYVAWFLPQGSKIPVRSGTCRI